MSPDYRLPHLLELARGFKENAGVSMNHDQMTQDQKALLAWYSDNKRDLPWRGKTDPYAIWISEVMLQQTTVTAVRPYYERFLARFPKLEDLAAATEAEVLNLWSGLGYYSRARMIHRAARELAAAGFPRTHEELLKLHGFGPYTARAVASLAFGEAVGAVDGNVIRVLSRKFGLKTQWWKPKGREEIQKSADKLVQGVSSSDVNQALMDLGSAVCTPRRPVCLLCPWMKSCQAFADGKPEALPIPKPRRAREIWLWEPQVLRRGSRIYLAKNGYAPFLKGQWLPPGRAEKKSSPPKKFLFRHSITHHDIFVVPQRSRRKPAEGKFVELKKIALFNPTSLMTKLLEMA
jgi:A/G-specific adenine glycosylase